MSRSHVLNRLRKRRARARKQGAGTFYGVWIQPHNKPMRPAMRHEVLALNSKFGTFWDSVLTPHDL